MSNPEITDVRPSKFLGVSAESARMSDHRHTLPRQQNGLPLVWGADGPAMTTPTRSRAVHQRSKRVFDIVMSALLLLALLPLFIAVALAIRLNDRGPVFFRQAREGLNGTNFIAYKFRSMKVKEGDPTGVVQTKRQDPRVSPVGRFLRRTSIDELPQLINVLKGEMSLVGPRPHVPRMLAANMPYEELVPYYPMRLAMLPGITGWAQANGLRGPTDDPVTAKARIDHDIAYIQNFTFWLDLKILLLTLRHEFVGGTGH